MNALILNIHLLEPVLIAELHGGDPNSAVGLSYIPGSTLRGALLVRYQQRHKLDDLAADETTRRLFFNGAVRYLNAYLIDEHGKRMLPTPLSWYIEKGSEDDLQEPIYDLAVKADRPALESPKTVHQAKPFCQLNHTAVWLDRPKQAIKVHIYRDRRNEQSGNDTLFRYEALAAGQILQAVILANDSADLETVADLLSPPELSLGKSRQAGYGRVRVEQVALDWAGEYEAGDGDDQKIIITCLSDALVRDSYGSYAGDLEPIFGKHQAAFTQLHLIGGFNRAWGLPGPQIAAIQAGSVFVYDYTPDLWEKVQRLAETGLGERLAEGFGRIAVNWQQYDPLTKSPPPPEPDSPLPEPLIDPHADFARSISERVLRARLDAQLAVTINKFDIKKNSLTNAQLSRLRRKVYQALQEDDLNLISDHLKNLKDVACKQFERAKLDNTPLSTWLADLISDPQNPRSVWQIMGVQQMEGPEIGQQRATRDKKLAREYALRLINGLLHKATKEGRHA